MSRKACARVSSSPAKCPCEAKHWGWKTISGVLSGYSDLANVGTLSATSGDMREAGATTPILHLFLLIQAASLHCTSSATLLEDFAITLNLLDRHAGLGRLGPAIHALLAA